MTKIINELFAINYLTIIKYILISYQSTIKDIVPTIYALKFPHQLNKRISGIAHKKFVPTPALNSRFRDESKFTLPFIKRQPPAPDRSPRYRH